jgi:glutamyl-tRNA synthetase
MSVITRFAPSPTGYLHIGGARTALFNWLFARHHGGQFLLRIEDTDRVRSTQQAVDAILDGLSWLGLTWDSNPIYQFSRQSRHGEIAHNLLKEGKAYYCYASPEELEMMRETQKKNGLPMRYDGRWRHKSPSEAPKGVAPVIRLKAPQEGTTTIHDQVKGDITVDNQQLDDMILLRADGSPTYMLAVVVDDHDMGITHVIRGDDHLTNSFRQIQLYQACNWSLPTFAHIPLIYGSDGTKLSKRHGALGIEAYRDMGFLPETMRNYLLRLGWGHGDDEIISTEKAIEWFDIKGIGTSPSRFDLTKLTSLNGHYMKQRSNIQLVQLIQTHIEKSLNITLLEKQLVDLEKAMPSLKERSKNLAELAESALFFVKKRPLILDDLAKKILDEASLNILAKFIQNLDQLENWNKHILEEETQKFTNMNDLKLGKLAQPLRAALCGTSTSPPIFDVMDVLGKDETLGRIKDIL